MAWSIVVVLNSRVQLIATVSTSGVMADEKRRVAVPKLAEARKPPTGATAPSAGASNRAAARATTGPREANRDHETDRRQLGGRRGGLRGARGGGHGEQRDGAGQGEQPPDHASGTQQARLNGRVGEGDRRRHAGGTTAGGQDRQQRGGQSGGDGGGRGHPVRPHNDVVGGDAVANERVSERLAEHGAGPDARGRADHGHDYRLPRDHAPDLTGSGRHRAQQRDLAIR